MFEGTWTATGTRRTLRLGPDRRAAIFELTGAMLLSGAQRPAVGFKAQAIGFSDSRVGMQGRWVWTDERGDMVYSELSGQAVGTGNRIAGTFIGGTGRYAGVTGDYTFHWQYVVDAEDGAVSGRVVDFEGRARLGQAAAATSSDGGATWSPTSESDPPTGHVVVHPQAWPGWPYDGLDYNHYGIFMPCGIIREGDHFYSAAWYLHRTGDGPSGIERQGITLLRTRDVSRPTGWQVLNAAGTYQDLATAAEPFGIVLALAWGAHSQAIVYDTVACQYVLFFTPADEEDVVKYMTSATLSRPSWSPPAIVAGTETLDHDGYVGILDPDSDGRNFEFVGETPYSSTR